MLNSLGSATLYGPCFFSRKLKFMHHDPPPSSFLKQWIRALPFSTDPCHRHMMSKCCTWAELRTVALETCCCRCGCILHNKCYDLFVKTTETSIHKLDLLTLMGVQDCKLWTSKDVKWSVILAALLMRPSKYVSSGRGEFFLYKCNIMHNNNMFMLCLCFLVQKRIEKVCQRNRLLMWLCCAGPIMWLLLNSIQCGAHKAWQYEELGVKGSDGLTTKPVFVQDSSRHFAVKRLVCYFK